MSRAYPLLIFDNSDDEDWSPERGDLTPPPSRKKQLFYQHSTAMREVTPEWEKINRPEQTDDSPSVAHSQRAGKREISSPVAGTPSPPKTRKLPILRWSKDMRLALHLLVTKFPSDWLTVEVIFNKLFEEELNLCGKLNGVGRTAMRQQYGPNERKKACWATILKTDLSPLETSEHDRMIVRIERVHNDNKVMTSPQLSAEQKPSSQSTGLRQAAARRSVVTSRAVRKPKSLTGPSTSMQRPTPPSTPPSRAQKAILPATPLSPTRRPTSVAVPFSMQELAPTDLTALNSMEGGPTPLTEARARMLVTRERPILNEIVPISTPDSPDVYFDPVPPEEAHPRLPSLLFRYYDAESIGINGGKKGFLAGQFIAETLGPSPPPLCANPLMFNWVENHLNRIKIASPFISVSTSFVWVVKQAAKRAKNNGVLTGRISVIDSEMFSAERRAFAVPPYYRKLAERKAFLGDTYRYGGTYEQLIWAKIPSATIVHDFSLDELKDNLSKYPTMSRGLKLDILERGQSSAKTQAMLKDRNVKLDLDLAKELAAMLLMLNIDVTQPEKISDLVSEFIEGWKIDVEKDADDRWGDLAGTFLWALTNHVRDVTSAESKHQRKFAKIAFIQGISSGVGAYNWRRRDVLIRAQKRKAESLGLPPVERREKKRFLLDRVEISVRPKIDLTGYRYDGSMD